MNLKQPFVCAILTAAVSFAAHAALPGFSEIGDAGQTPATVQGTGLTPGTELGFITGDISSQSDADLYAFQIDDAMSFSASTARAGATSLDTALFLFTSTGQAIATNDDAPDGSSLGSTLPAGHPLYATLAPGTYYLGISLTGNEAVNSVNQILFAGNPGGDVTAVRGAATGVNPTALSTFNGGSSSPETTTAYRIELTGASTAAAVPEPSVWATMGVASLAVAFGAGRRRRRLA